MTAGYLTGEQQIPVPRSRRPVVSEKGTPLVTSLKLTGCRENNLQGVDLELPLGVFTAVTGPSGSGKSTLIEGTLFPILARRFHRQRVKPGRHEKLEGLRHLDKVIRVDQSPIGNTPSSNPATYTGVFDSIRQLFAEIPEAAERKYSARTFSFNVPGGRCETCEGSGQRRIEMHFLPDVWVPCEECESRRYNEDVLDIKYHGRSIADVLEMQIGEATELFSSHAKITRVLQTLCDVGLDYVTLGQSAPTLSGGEAQRVKLASELARPGTGRTLYLLDEPTTGLHFDDIVKLLDVIQRLVELGNTVVVIEHNLDVIKCADWVIDMGPGAGVDGGHIVFTGTPEQLAESARKRKSKNAVASLTAPFLADTLKAAQRNSGTKSRDPSKPTETKPTVKKQAVRKQAVTKQAVRKTRANQTQTAKSDIPSTKTKSRPDSTQSPTNVRIDSPQSLETSSPWRVLGRRWHSLAKGFPEGEQPEWPLELAERVMSLMEQVDGDVLLNFDEPNKVHVRLAGEQRAWAEIQTKDADAITVCLAGPKDAVNEQALEELPLPSSQVASRAGKRNQSVVKLSLSKLSHARSRKLKTFLKDHLAATVKLK